MRCVIRCVDGSSGFGRSHAQDVSIPLLSTPAQSLIINLPGQPKSIAQTLGGLKDEQGKALVQGIFAAVPYCIDLLGGPYIETKDEFCSSFRPQTALKSKRV